jgi:hypothetical protein
MIKINLRIEDSSTRLDDIKEPDLKVKASSLCTKLDAIISPLSCPVCGKDGTVEVTLVFDKFVQTRIHPDHCCHREFSAIIYRALPPLLKELERH